MGRGKLRFIGIIFGILILIGMIGSCSDQSAPTRSAAIYTPVPEITLSPTATELTFTDAVRGMAEANDGLVDTIDDTSANPDAAIEYATLRSGDSGDNVRSLQMRLIELGFLTADADGDYGSKTVSAVKRAQALAGLEVTGVADSKTQHTLWTGDAPTAQPQPTKIKPTQTPEPVYEEASDEEASDDECDYIANKSTKKFHYPWCSSVDQMKEKNKWYFTGSRETLIAKGYVPCKRCDP